MTTPMDRVRSPDDDQQKGTVQFLAKDYSHLTVITAVDIQRVIRGYKLVSVWLLSYFLIVVIHTSVLVIFQQFEARHSMQNRR
jgi:hypothetical protein